MKRERERAGMRDSKKEELKKKKRNGSTTNYKVILAFSFFDERVDNAKDVPTIMSLAISRRDMATQMSLQDSYHSSFRRYGLGAAVLYKDLDRCERITKALQAGIVHGEAPSVVVLDVS